MKNIEQLVKPYIDLPLECDGLTRVISYILDKNNIKHKTCIGLISNKKDKVVEHYWIELSDGRYIDYRARMWLGDDESVPNGIFNPENYKETEYKYLKKTDLNTSEYIFRILTV